MKILAIVVFSLLLTTAFAQDLDFHPASGPEATLYAKSRQSQIDFWKSLTADVFPTKGNKNISNPELKRRTDKLLLFSTYCLVDGFDSPIDKDFTYATVLVQQGDISKLDPLLIWSAAVSIGDTRRMYDISKIYLDQQDHLPDNASSQPSILSVYPLSMRLCWRRNFDPETSQSQINEGVALAQRLAMTLDGIIRSHACDSHPEVFIQLGSNLHNCIPSHTELILATVTKALQEAGTTPWLAKSLLASLHINTAWSYRSNSWGNEVTDEGWSGFRKHLALADPLLEEAYALNPKEPILCKMGIGVAGCSTSTNDANTWLVRSITACFDYLPSLDSRLNYLLPRWGGDYQAMLDLGKACLDTKRFDTEVPWFYVTCLQEIMADARQMKKLDQMKALFNSPQVEQALNQCFNGYTTKDPIRARQIVSTKGSWLWLCGRSEEAKVLLKTLPRSAYYDLGRRLLYVDKNTILGPDPDINRPRKIKKPTPEPEPEPEPSTVPEKPNF